MYLTYEIKRWPSGYNYVLIYRDNRMDFPYTVISVECWEDEVKAKLNRLAPDNARDMEQILAIASDELKERGLLSH